MKDVILALTRAQVIAEHEQRHGDARCIARGIAAMLSLDDDADVPTTATGTRAGGFEAVPPC